MISLKDKLTKIGDGKWRKLAMFQKGRFTNASPEFIREHSKKYGKFKTNYQAQNDFKIVL